MKKMKLINANVLLETLEQKHYNPDDYEKDSIGEAWTKGFNNGITSAIHEVIYMPDIEVFPVGRWFMCDGKLVCTRCRKKAHQMMDENNCFYYIETPYCPNCGAEMH